MTDNVTRRTSRPISQQYLNNPEILDEEIKLTNIKIRRIFTASKIIIVIELLITGLFNPLSLGLVGLTSLTGYSFAIISGSSGITALALIVTKTFSTRILVKKGELIDIKSHFPPRNSDRPVGLRNALHNCWANSMIQLMAHIKSLRDAINNLDDKDSLHNLKTMISSYLKDEKNPNRYVSQVNSQDLREIIHSNSFTGLISLDKSDQEDPHEAFSIIDKIVPGPPLRKIDIYSCENMPPPKPVSNTEKIIEIKANNTFEVVLKRDPDKMIELPVELHENPDPTSTLFSLVDSFFNCHQAEENTITEADGIDGIPHQYKKNEDKYRFSTPPEEIFFHLKRYNFEVIHRIDPKTQKDSPLLIPHKIETKIKDIATLHLEKEKHILNGDALYDLDAFIMHVGTNMHAGHYFCCLKINGAWYECNDTEVKKLSEKEALQYGSQAYLLHYNKS